MLTTRSQLLNILRNTVACYAGAVADADVITTTLFDAPTGPQTEASRRNARNTEHVRAEECHLAQVVDPAGRSCYIEWYSNEVHIVGRQMMNGIGGSGDFTRNAYISIFTCPSRQKGGKISTIVPMDSNMDHSMHSVQVLATEHGVADLRGKDPSERARIIVEHCPRRNTAISSRPTWPSLASQLPFRSCFAIHRKFEEEGDMRSVTWAH